MSEWAIRQGAMADVEWLAAAILEAERSGTSSSLYERVFDLEGAEVVAILTAALREDVPGSELCAESFLVATDGTERVGAIATWVEGESGAPSARVRATLLAHVVGPPRWAAAVPKLSRLGAIAIDREAGAAQIEAVYVAPSHRGRRVTQRLIAHAVTVHREARVKKVQILSARGNDSSARAFQRSGFTKAAETSTDRAEVLALFPGTGRVLWELAL